MNKNPDEQGRSRLEREVEREREQRLKNDDARAGIASDDDLRLKDARDNNASSGQLHRHR
jgi:hypothetical protein